MLYINLLLNIEIRQVLRSSNSKIDFGIVTVRSFRRHIPPPLPSLDPKFAEIFPAILGFKYGMETEIRSRKKNELHGLAGRIFGPSYKFPRSPPDETCQNNGQIPIHCVMPAKVNGADENEEGENRKQKVYLIEFSILHLVRCLVFVSAKRLVL